MKSVKRYLRFLYAWSTSVCDPLYATRGLRAFRFYLSDWRRYSRLPGAERIRLMDSMPLVHDRTGVTGFDAHYFYLSGWAMRRIVAKRPANHVDVGSLTMFANLLASVVPVAHVDYRPLTAKVDGLACLAGDLLALPFSDRSISSLSCLHVAEHVGLGRYGDRLDPAGTVKAAHELARILKEDGDLYFAVPVGKPRVCFNAHRIHSVQSIRDYFDGLKLVEFSAVDDRGRFIENAGISDFDTAEYACGMFWFTKTSRAENK